jgi:hypothetical protein
MVKHHLLYNLLSSRPLPKEAEIIMYEHTILHIVLYGYKIWSLTLREGRSLRVFGNKELQRIFGHMKETGIK